MPFLLADRYLATAKVVILGTPEVMDFGASVVPDTPSPRRHPLSPKIAVVRSDRVLGRVVDQMPQPAARKPGLGGRFLSTVGLSTSTAGLSPELRRQVRIDQLRQATVVDDGGGGAILEIRMTGGDPASAAFSVNAIADSFVQYEREQRDEAARRAISWLNQKVSELRDQIRRRDEAMAALLPELDEIPSASMQGGDEAKRQMGDELRAARVELLATQQRKAQLAPRVRGASVQVDDHELLALRSRYQAVKARLDNARLTYTETHPEVGRLKAVLEDLEAKLGGAGSETPGGPAADPDSLREYRNLAAEEARLQARVRVISQALRQMVQSKTEKASTIAEYERLEREAGIDRQMLGLLLQRLNEATLTSANQAETSRVLDYAVRPTRPIAPNRPLVLGAGLALAVGFALGIGLLREFMDPSLYDAEGVARAMGAPLLGMIPKIPPKKATERQTTPDYATPAGESYRNLRTAVFFAGAAEPFRSLLVTSAVSGEGKTTMAVNLAASIAQTGRRVLLVDADLRRPRVDSVLALLRGPGLAELIRADAKLEDVIRRPIGIEIDAITSGEIPDNPTELLESLGFERILERLVEDYDLVLIDGPVLLSVSDALVVGARADRVLLVSKLGSVDRRAFERVRRDLERVRANVIGLVVNQVPMTNPYAYPSYLHSPYVTRRRAGRGARKRGRARPEGA